MYSHSRLSNFENCPRKFQYRYVLKIPADGESIEAFVGKRVHEVLERLYRATQRGQLPSLPQVLFRYGRLFEEAYDASRVYVVRRERPIQFYRELGERCLSNYYRAHYPFDRDETLGLEERVHFELGDAAGSVVRIQGFIDRIARGRDGVIEIHDYKTGARIPNQAQVDEDRQLALYQLGLSERYGVAQPLRLVWHFLRRGIVRTSSRTPDQLDSLRSRTLRLVERIQLEDEYPAVPGPLCSWCEYRERCPASPERRADLPTWEEQERPAPLHALARSSPTRRERIHAREDQLELPFASTSSLG